MDGTTGAGAPPAAAGPRGALGRVATYLELVKFSHTVFALPFALMGVVLAARGLPGGRTLAWVVVAMVGARTGAMAVNRIADRQLDALNPRTANRALPRGQVRVAEAAALAAGGFALLLLAAWMLNPLCGLLAPLAIAVVAGYSYTKRFTILSHLVLGLSLALAPLGGWIAVTGRPAWPPAVLGLAVLFWVAGFDVLYALADLEFDRRAGVHSLPARLGVGPSLLVARACHAATLACLALLPTVLDLGALYLAGWLGAAALLIYEHLLVYRHGLSRLDVAFFNVNGILSVGLFLFTLGDLLWGR